MNFPAKKLIHDVQRSTRSERTGKPVPVDDKVNVNALSTLLKFKNCRKMHGLQMQTMANLVDKAFWSTNKLGDVTFTV